MDKMTLSIGDTEFDTAATSAHSISLPIGNYMSTCKTLGSNPASVIKIYLGDVEVGFNKKSVRPKKQNMTKKYTKNDTKKIVT